MGDITRGALVSVFLHERGIILGKRERMSKILVTLVTGSVGVFLVVLIGVSISWYSMPFSETILMMSMIGVYYFAAWIFPWFLYGDGLNERKEKKMRYWMCSFAGQAFLLELYSFYNVQCLTENYRGENHYQCYDTVWWLVIAGLVALPFVILVLGSTIVVYLNIDEDVAVVNFPMFERRRGNTHLGCWASIQNGPRVILRGFRRKGKERGRSRSRVEERFRETAEEGNNETGGGHSEIAGERNNDEVEGRNNETVNIGGRGCGNPDIVGNHSIQIEGNNRERTRENDSVGERRGCVESDNSWVSWGRCQYNAVLETINWLPTIAGNQESSRGIDRTHGGILILLRPGQNTENGSERLSEEGPSVLLPNEVTDVVEDSIVDHRDVVNLIVNFPDEVSFVLEDSVVDNILDAPDEDVPPSYGEVEQDDLPLYSQLGTKRLRIGNNIIVMDKNLNVNTFQQDLV